MAFVQVHPFRPVQWSFRHACLHSILCALNFGPFQPFHLKLRLQHSNPMAQGETKGTTIIFCTL